MRAIVYDEYGPPDVLRLGAVDNPVVEDGEALVRVPAAAVNPGDWDILRGMPYVLRPMIGLARPKNRVLGLAVAGRVEVVAVEGVIRFFLRVPDSGWKPAVEW